METGNRSVEDTLGPGGIEDGQGGSKDSINIRGHVTTEGCFILERERRAERP